MTITVLVDNYCAKRGLKGEHGFSLYIEASGKRILFDAGQSSTFLDNAAILGIDLSSLDAVVLSHGHYDHAGGLSALYAALGGDPPPLFAGADFGAPRISIHDSGREAIGFESPADLPVIIIERPEEVASGLYILPRADRIDGSEPSPRFLRSAGGIERVDEFDDELSLAAVLPEGLAVLTGCAHRGIVNIAESARLVFPGAPIKTLVGGFHLVDSPVAELSRVAQGLAALEPEAVYCSHCTGPRGFAALSSALPSKVTWLSCGMRISL